MAIRISVIIPCFNEERYLPHLLADIAEARRRYHRGPAAVEIVVADNGSSDATRRIAETNGCKVVSVEPRVIGAVRNGGAQAASGELLAFVDADTRIHPETFNSMDEFFRSGAHIVGASGALPARRALGIDVAWWLLGGLVLLSGYGIPRRRHELVPTGVVCCMKADWRAVGGYDEQLMFAEDVRLLLDLQRLGRRRRQKCGWLGGAPAVFSTRKFDEHGDWHYITEPFRLLLLALADRRALDLWVERYWYGRQREGTSVERQTA